MIGQGKRSVLQGTLVEGQSLRVVREALFVAEPNGGCSAMRVLRRVRAADKGPEKQFAREKVGAVRP